MVHDGQDLVNKKDAARHLFCLLHYMFAAQISGGPVFVGQFVNPYSFAGAGVDELSAAQIEAAVGGAFLVGFEEDQVTGHQFLGGFGAEAQLVLLVRSTGDGNALLGEDVLEIAGAVEGLGRSAAELVGHADVGLGSGDKRTYLALGQDGLAVGGQGAFGEGAAGLRFRNISAPLAGLGVFKGPPGGIVYDARDADLIVPLEFCHGPFGFRTEDAVQTINLVADAVQLLLEQHHFMTMGTLLQGWGSSCRQLGGSEDKSCRQGGQQEFQRPVLPVSSAPLMKPVQGAEDTYGMEITEVMKGTKMHEYRPFSLPSP